MSTEIKIRALMGILFVCILGMGVQGYFLWRMDQQLAGVTLEDDIPKSIQERLEAQLADEPVNPGSLSFQGYPTLSSNYDPFIRMQQMRQQMDTLFNSFSTFGSVSSVSPSGLGQAFSFSSATPQLEFLETEDEYQVKIQSLPDQELSIQTELEANLLTITGTVRQNRSNIDSSNGFASNFVSSSQFTRSFDLDKRVDEFGVFTEQTEGGLVVKVPKV